MSEHAIPTNPSTNNPTASICSMVLHFFSLSLGGTIGYGQLQPKHIVIEFLIINRIISKVINKSILL